MKTIKIGLAAIMVLTTVMQLNAQSKNWLVSSGYSYDVTFVNERIIDDDIFLYHIEGHNSVWFEVGKQTEKIFLAFF
ncbi:MAG: hypothetical protein JJ971_07705 [Balneolaceae bacterium]|nr:hypothetical protein [Balneolaceae bacterium]MBO6546880.1 hypothetical protein [Balneolaceae bacterium]MBO6649240.1 hypothetical protein [Balneolaceae bacterium]